MNKLRHKITTHPHYPKLLHWGKLITVTGSAQVIVQAVGFLSGILVIRLLPVEEYALYTIANTMLGTMTILSDGGISTGVMAQGGKIWQDKEKLGSVLATGMNLRRKFAIISLIISIPILCYLLLSHGASWLTTALIAISLIPAFYAALSDSLLQIPIKLHQAITPLQRNQVEVGVGRLLLTGLTLFAFPWAFIAIIASGIPRIWGNIKLRKIAGRFVEKKQEKDPVVEKEILKIVKRTLPTAIYYSLSGQITLWIISIFGQTASVAQLGALGRISVIFTIFSAIIGTLVVPRFSKLINERKTILNRYNIILLSTSLIIVLMVGTVFVASDQILWLLGSEYSNLQFELQLSTICACLNVLTGVSFSLYAAKGWVLPPVIPIVKNIITIVFCCLVFNLSTLVGALYLNLLLVLTSMIMNVVFGYYHILKIRT